MNQETIHQGEQELMEVVSAAGRKGAGFNPLFPIFLKLEQMQVLLAAVHFLI
jgi:hypothetical protein